MQRNALVVPFKEEFDGKFEDVLQHIAILSLTVVKKLMLLKNIFSLITRILHHLILISLIYLLSLFGIAILIILPLAIFSSIRPVPLFSNCSQLIILSVLIFKSFPLLPIPRKCLWHLNSWSHFRIISGFMCFINLVCYYEVRYVSLSRGP
jgi:hypothetical protein